MARLHLGIVGVVCASVLAWPADAAACTCGRGPGRFLAKKETLLPANARGILWWASGERLSSHCVDKACADGRSGPVVGKKPDAGEFSVAKVVGNREASVPHTLELVEHEDRYLEGWMSSEAVLVAVSEPLEPGARYRFRHERDGLDDELVEVRVDESSLESATVELVVDASKLGELKVGAGMSCSEQVRAVERAVHMALPRALEKYRGALQFTTRVDGKPWRSEESMCTPPAVDRSWVGKGRDKLFAACSMESGAPFAALHFNLEEGLHQVTMIATLPGTDANIATRPIMIDWRCPESVAAPAASSGPSAVASDAAADASASPSPSAGKGCSGCSLDARARPSGRTGWWLALLGALVGARRGRRRLTDRSACRARPRDWAGS
jgi:hypothetical protein